MFYFLFNLCQILTGGGVYLSSMQKETGLSQLLAEKLKNLFVITKHENCFLISFAHFT